MILPFFSCHHISRGDHRDIFLVFVCLRVGRSGSMVRAAQDWRPGVLNSNPGRAARKLWQFRLPHETHCLLDETLVVSMPMEVKDPSRFLAFFT